jgi:hypothetical protein
VTAIPSSFNAWHPHSIGTQLAPGATLLSQASAQIGQGQLATLDASGNAALNDGTVPGLIAAGVGFPGKLSDTSPTAGVAPVSMWWGFGSMVFSTLSADGFTAADSGGVPAFIATENTIGRKSNVAGSNRSIAGMVYGINGDGTARFWGGPMAQAVARSILLLNAYPLAAYTIADAAANTATAETVMRRPAVKGTVTSITFTGAAIAANNTDYDTVTVSKRDGAGGAAVVLGTYDTRAANQGAVTAFTPAAFLLSVVAGALFLLETDIVTVIGVKGGAGKVLTGEILVNGKAI